MPKAFENHYATLGVNSSATVEEVRRAYRILARRYHPDVNPGRASEERFKSISEAYRVLSDQDRRHQFDVELEAQQRRGGAARSAYSNIRGGDRKSAREKFNEAKYDQFGRMEGHASSGTASSSGAYRNGATTSGAFRPAARPAPSSGATLAEMVKKVGATLRQAFGAATETATESSGVTAPISRISIIEVSVTMKDAILGVKKAVEIAEPEGTRKVSVRIPPGVRSGSVVRLRAKSTPGEELVLIVRVASHPLLSIQTKGLVLEVPITLNEAISGASISVPTLEDPVVVRVPPGTQSGSEVRLKGKGILAREGERGDLFLRFLVKIPEAAEAVGLRDKAGELEKYYGTHVRETLPKSLAELMA